MMHFKKKLIFPLLLLMGLVTLPLSNCKKEEDSCNTTNVSYKDAIKPLLTSKGCLASGCHSSSDGVYDMSTYTKLKGVVDAGRLIGAVKRSPGFSAMPKTGDKLDDCSISQIEAWVNQGAKDN